MEPGINAATTADRVRERSPSAANKLIDRETEGRVLRFATKDKEEITRRIDELEREWDMERVLESNASVLMLAGLGAFAISGSKKWLIVPGVVLPFFMQHALQGWCPPVPAFRKIGVRTQQEIEREKYALKVLRGDFDALGKSDDPTSRVEKALEAVRASRP
jgi:hypothetical protein